MFAKAVEQKYPLDEHILNILKDYRQDVLGLRDEDVASIELDITSVKEAEYQQQLQIQKQQEAERLQQQRDAEASKKLRLQQEAKRLQRQRDTEASEKLRLQQEVERLQRQRDAEAAKQLRLQQEAERLQLQRDAEAAKQLRLQQKLEKNKSGYQLKTFQFEAPQIALKSSLLRLVKTPEIKRITKSAKYFTQDLGNGVILKMVAIPGGTFMMGSPKNEQGRDDSESPQHQVNVPSFFMGKYAVTQKQWQAVAALEKVKIDLESNPSRFKGDNLPIECVSWDDAQEFCARLSQKTQKTYRLPSEAEWEYACRGRTTTPFYYFGETISTDLANYNGNYTYGNGVKGEYREKTTKVGIFPANPCGLYDMCGNVWEWCEDEWHENYMNAPSDGSVWSDGSNEYRIIRGGSWMNYPKHCRAASRSNSNKAGSDNIYGSIGFRIVCAVEDILQ